MVRLTEFESATFGVGELWPAPIKPDFKPFLVRYAQDWEQKKQHEPFRYAGLRRFFASEDNSSQIVVNLLIGLQQIAAAYS